MKIIAYEGVSNKAIATAIALQKKAKRLQRKIILVVGDEKIIARPKRIEIYSLREYALRNKQRRSRYIVLDGSSEGLFGVTDEFYQINDISISDEFSEDADENVEHVGGLPVVANSMTVTLTKAELFRSVYNEDTFGYAMEHLRAGAMPYHILNRNNQTFAISCSPAAGSELRSSQSNYANYLQINLPNFSISYIGTDEDGDAVIFLELSSLTQCSSAGAGSLIAQEFGGIEQKHYVCWYPLYAEVKLKTLADIHVLSANIADSPLTVDLNTTYGPIIKDAFSHTFNGASVLSYELSVYNDDYSTETLTITEGDVSGSLPAQDGVATGIWDIYLTGKVTINNPDVDDPVAVLRVTSYSRTNGVLSIQATFWYYVNYVFRRNYVNSDDIVITDSASSPISAPYIGAVRIRDLREKMFDDTYPRAIRINTTLGQFVNEYSHTYTASGDDKYSVSDNYQVQQTIGGFLASSVTVTARQTASTYLVSTDSGPMTATVDKDEVDTDSNVCKKLTYADGVFNVEALTKLPESTYRTQYNMDELLAAVNTVTTQYSFSNTAHNTDTIILDDREYAFEDHVASDYSYTDTTIDGALAAAPTGAWLDKKFSWYHDVDMSVFPALLPNDANNTYSGSVLSGTPFFIRVAGELTPIHVYPHWIVRTDTDTGTLLENTAVVAVYVNGEHISTPERSIAVNSITLNPSAHIRAVDGESAFFEDVSIAAETHTSFYHGGSEVFYVDDNRTYSGTVSNILTGKEPSSGALDSIRALTRAQAPAFRNQFGYTGPAGFEEVQHFLSGLGAVWTGIPKNIVDSREVLNLRRWSSSRVMRGQCRSILHGGQCVVHWRLDSDTDGVVVILYHVEEYEDMEGTVKAYRDAYYEDRNSAQTALLGAEIDALITVVVNNFASKHFIRLMEPGAFEYSALRLGNYL